MSELFCFTLFENESKVDILWQISWKRDRSSFEILPQLYAQHHTSSLGHELLSSLKDGLARRHSGTVHGQKQPSTPCLLAAYSARATGTRRLLRRAARHERHRLIIGLGAVANRHPSPSVLEASACSMRRPRPDSR